jgi:hypothetical protein
MLTDDIEYIGTRLAPAVAAARPFPPVSVVGEQHLISRLSASSPCDMRSFFSIGITLRIEKCGDQPANELRFLKSRTKDVLVGRRPTCEADLSPDPELGGSVSELVNVVTFKCPVVSRKHAKIVFAEDDRVRSDYP